jgi:hypothetical protein
MLAGSDRVLFGAAYYHEYQPYDGWMSISISHPRSRPTRALGCSGPCSGTTVTADGRAAAVGVGTVRERDWLFDGHARIGEALDD